MAETAGDWLGGQLINASIQTLNPPGGFDGWRKFFKPVRWVIDAASSVTTMIKDKVGESTKAGENLYGTLFSTLGDLSKDALLNYNKLNALITQDIEMYLSILPIISPVQVKLEISNLDNQILGINLVSRISHDGLARSATITLDQDAAGIGWFVDETPYDHAEFAQQLSNTAFQATEGSPAYGKYDLYTVLLHELGHLLGFSPDTPRFSDHIQTIDGSKIFAGNNFTATLTPDGDHLNDAEYPNDLMNELLSPGIRRLPSDLDVQIIQTLRDLSPQPNIATRQVAPLTSLVATIPASLSQPNNAVTVTSIEPVSIPSQVNLVIPIATSANTLPAMDNGNFDLANPTDPAFGWQTRGATSINNGQAILNEDNRLNTGFSQTFTIPNGAKILQFKILNTNLGSTPLNPADAFEVALLDANTKTSLVGTANGLTQTDAFLNLQQDGQTYLSPKVTIQRPNQSIRALASTSSPITVNVDLTGIAAGTTATLFFDLLGFGQKDASVAIDDVVLLSDNANSVPTITNLSGDTNINEGAIAHFTATATDPEKDPLTYTWDFGDNSQPATGQSVNHTFANDGIYTLTLTVSDNNGASTSQNLNVTVANVAPTITDLSGNTNPNEGETATYTAIATDPGNDPLTYTWNFGDGSNPVEEQSVNHKFADNGSYMVTLTVTDSDGASSSQTLNVTVNNVAPTITNLSGNTNPNEGETATYTAIATDPGNDPLTYTWNFGDGSNPVEGQSVNHKFADNGSYMVTLTVTDIDGASSSQTLNVNVNNVAPTITNLSGNTNPQEGETATYTAIATDPGNDPLTYTWNFGDGSNPVEGQSVNHKFADNGSYMVTLTVTDIDGASSSQTLNVNVANVAPTVNAGSDRAATQGTAVTFAGNFSDAGISDTHTIAWDFGDGGTASDTLTPTHTYTTAGDYTVTLTVTDKDGAIASDTLNISVTTTPQLPTVSIDDVTINPDKDGVTYATFTVKLSQASSQDITVNFNTTDGTAKAGIDYIARQGQITFTEGQTVQTIQIALKNHKRGDIDGDGDVDRDDLNLLLAGRNTPAKPAQPTEKTFFLNLDAISGATLLDNQGMGTLLSEGRDPRDLDGDGMITVLDARILAILMRSQ